MDRASGGYVSRMPSLVLAAVYANGIEALEAIGGQQTDLLLLDIQLPKLNGLELLRSLENPPAVIFTTAFPEHAVGSRRADPRWRKLSARGQINFFT